MVYVQSVGRTYPEYSPAVLVYTPYVVIADAVGIGRIIEIGGKSVCFRVIYIQAVYRPDP